MTRLILASGVMVLIAAAGHAQDFGNIGPQTVLGNPSATAKQPAQPMPAISLTLGAASAYSGFTVNSQNFTNPSGGVNGGLRLNMSNLGGLSGNPGVNGAVAASIFTDNTSGRTEIVALNTVCAQQPVSSGGGVGINHCVEFNTVQSQIATVPTDPFSFGPVSHAIELVASTNTSASPQNPQAALWIWSQDDNNTTDFAFGVAVSRVKYAGFACAPYGGSDTGTYFQTACYMDNSNSPISLKITGNHTSVINTTGAGTLTYLWQGSVANIQQNGNFILNSGTMTSLLNLTGPEGSQLELSLGGQTWNMNMVSGGNLYFLDGTHSKFPLTVAANSTLNVIIGTKFTVAGLPSTTPGTGGGTVCADSAGDFYVKATCP